MSLLDSMRHTGAAGKIEPMLEVAEAKDVIAEKLAGDKKTHKF